MEAWVGEEDDGDARVIVEEEDGGCGLDHAGEELWLLSAMASACCLGALPGGGRRKRRVEWTEENPRRQGLVL